jgi:hypothetical protein
MNDRFRSPREGGAPSSADFRDGEDDRLLRQVRAALTPMPVVDRRAIAQILTAVADRKRTPWQRFLSRFEGVREWWQFSTPPLARAGGMAALALTIGFVARGYLMRPDARLDGRATDMVATGVATPQDIPQSSQPGVSQSAPQTTLRAVEGAADASTLPIPVQFMLDAREVAGGTTVSLVGDFNDWDVSALPLTLDNGVWSTTLPLPPGRHVYAFVINGKRWIADPRAPQAPDADFGRPGSVILVRTP